MIADVNTMTGGIVYGATGVTEIIQNVRTILATRKGPQPLDREFGLSFDFLDDTSPAAMAAVQSEVLQAVRKYEPRAAVKSISFNNDPLSGKIYPTVKVEVRL